MSLNIFQRRQLKHEIVWCQEHINSLASQAARRPSVVREINDLRRQIKEKEQSLAWDGFAHIVPGYKEAR